MKATIAVLGFIISSAAKHSIDNESLSSELQQLGLPKGRGSPQGGTMSQTCWDVAGSSQPCLLHTQMEGRLPAVLSSITSLLYHQFLGVLRCFGEVWQLQVWCEQRDSSLVSPHKQSMPASCAVLHVTDPQNCRRLRTCNRCRTGSKGTWDKTSVFVSPKGQQSSHLLIIILWRVEQCLYGKMTGGKISGTREDTFVS